MEGLIVLAIIWFVVSQIGKAAKKAGSENSEARQRAADPAARPAPASPKAPPVAAPSIWSQISEMMALEEPVKRAPQEGGAYRDGEGCVGGSLAHDSHEGMAQGGSIGYTPLFESTLLSSEWVEIPHAQVHHRALTSTDMRSAVVMAEILDRPVALRARKGRGTFAR